MALLYTFARSLFLLLLLRLEAQHEGRETFVTGLNVVHEREASRGYLQTAATADSTRGLRGLFLGVTLFLHQALVCRTCDL